MCAPLKYCVKEILTFESAINRLALSLLIECPSVGECPVGGGGGGRGYSCVGMGRILPETLILYQTKI